MTGELATDLSAACPDENALAELVQGLLDDVDAARIEVHLDGCEDCRRIVSALGQSSYLAQRRTRVDSARAASSAVADAPSTWSMAPPASVAIPPPGTILAGKYRVERLLGQGGMGFVVAATHVTLGKLVALKLMRPDVAVDAGAAQRFVREARAASLLRSEHIARVIDLDTLDDGAPYIAMEYLEGEDLGALLVRRGTIAAHEAATYVVQVCDAVAEAHAAGIVHRDLKPANLFLTQRGNTPCVKVLDFGVSKIIAGGPLADNVASTDTKALVGSPHYMAPEQLISAKSVDPRTDIWALGCILFELVSGKSPFAGTALAQVLASILRDEVPVLRELCPHLPDGFARVVERCLAKDPAERYQRVEELAAALAPFARPDAPREAPAMPAIPVAVAAPIPVAAPRPPAAAPSRRLHRGLVASALLAVLGIGGYAGYRVTRHDPPRADASTRPAAVPAAPAVVDARVADAPPAPDAAAVEPDAAPRLDGGRKKSRALADDLIGPSFD